MRNPYPKLILLPFAFAAIACVEAKLDNMSSEIISFDLASLQAIGTKAACDENEGGMILMDSESDVKVALIHETSDMDTIKCCKQTRATRYNSEEGFRSQSFGVYGWNLTDSETLYTREEVSYTDGAWKPKTDKKWKTGCEYSFVALYPYSDSGSEFSFTPNQNPGGVTFFYTNNSNVFGASKDYMLAYFKGTKTDSNPKLTFTHPFTCVQFVAGSGLTVNSIKVEGLYVSGNCAVTTNIDKSGNNYYTYSWTPGTTFKHISCSAGDELITIPQDLSSANVKLTVNITVDGYTFNSYVTLNSGSWQAGKVNKYTLTTTQDASVEVTDQISGKQISNVKIQNTGASKAYIRATLVGGWYLDDGLMVASWALTAGSFVNFPGDNWTRCDDDGYYYYKYPVEAGQYTGSAFFTMFTAPDTAPVEGAHLELAILAEAVIWDADKVRVAAAWPQCISILK